MYLLLSDFKHYKMQKASEINRKSNGVFNNQIRISGRLKTNETKKKIIIVFVSFTSRMLIEYTITQTQKSRPEKVSAGNFFSLPTFSVLFDNLVFPLAGPLLLFSFFIYRVVAFLFFYFYFPFFPPRLQDLTSLHKTSFDRERTQLNGFELL